MVLSITIRSILYTNSAGRMETRLLERYGCRGCSRLSGEQRKPDTDSNTTHKTRYWGQLVRRWWGWLKLWWTIYTSIFGIWIKFFWCKTREYGVRWYLEAIGHLSNDFMNSSL